MIEGYSRGLTVAAAASTGLVAGVFFAFSTFTMKGLRSLPPAPGMSAMQAINKAAPTPLFMTALFGTALVCVGLGIRALTHLQQSTAPYLLVGSILFLAGIALTIVYHVPHNDALARIDPSTMGAVANNPSWAMRSRYASMAAMRSLLPPAWTLSRTANKSP